MDSLLRDRTSVSTYFVCQTFPIREHHVFLVRLPPASPQRYFLLRPLCLSIDHSSRGEQEEAEM